MKPQPVPASTASTASTVDTADASGTVAGPHRDDREADAAHMRRDIAVARDALAAGNMPYGAVLVVDGRAVFAAGNEQRSTGDCTAHAETVLVRRARERLGAAITQGATVYASGEPCAMCCGALFWAGVRRVVYAASQAEMARVLGGDLLPVDARSVFAGSAPPVQVDGPLLEAESVAVLEQAARGAQGDRSCGPSPSGSVDVPRVMRPT